MKYYYEVLKDPLYVKAHVVNDLGLEVDNYIGLRPEVWGWLNTNYPGATQDWRNHDRR